MQKLADESLAGLSPSSQRKSLIGPSWHRMHGWTVRWCVCAVHAVLGEYRLASNFGAQSKIKRQSVLMSNKKRNILNRVRRAPVIRMVMTTIA